MESKWPLPDPDEVRAELAAADLARARLSGGVRLPSGLLPVLGAAIALQIGTAAAGIASQALAGMAVVVVGLVVLFSAVGWALLSFRRVNGIRVDGFASQVVLGSGVTATGAYVVGFVGATWAALSSTWWLVVLAAVVGGVGYAVGARQWWKSYLVDPEAHAGGASPRVLALLAAVACVGLVVLMVAG